MDTAPPAVDLPKAISVWLADLDSVARPDERPEDWLELLPSSAIKDDGQRLLLDPKLGESFKNGRRVYEAMKRLYGLMGLRPQRLELTPDETPEARLSNWKKIFPYLQKHFGVELASREPLLSDKKALLVSGGARGGCGCAPRSFLSARLGGTPLVASRASLTRPVPARISPPQSGASSSSCSRSSAPACRGPSRATTGQRLPTAVAGA